MKIKTFDISPEVMDVLERSIINENSLALPPGQLLPRPLYEAVNKVLTMAGGKWSRGAKAHVFPSDPREKLGLAIQNGKVANEKQTYQYFPTPAQIVRQMMLWADIKKGHRILEPSAGHGAIIDGIIEEHGADVEIVAVELENVRALSVMLKIGHCCERDFLLAFQEELGTFDRILMNPPFTGGQDVRHIKHALKFLRPGGRLVAICSGGTRAEKELKPLAEHWETLPEDTFKESGTGVRTVLLMIEDSNTDLMDTLRRQGRGIPDSPQS